MTGQSDRHQDHRKDGQRRERRRQPALPFIGARHTGEEEVTVACRSNLQALRKQIYLKINFSFSGRLTVSPKPRDLSERSSSTSEFDFRSVWTERERERSSRSCFFTRQALFGSDDEGD